MEKAQDEIESPRLLDHENLLRDEASLVAEGYVRGIKEGKYVTLAKKFKSMRLRKSLKMVRFVIFLEIPITKKNH